MVGAIRRYAVATSLSVLVICIALWLGGLVDAWIIFVLAALEISLSFDNAVVNSRVLKDMSRLWQTLFLTVGIIIAVFIIRFVLPLIIVMLTAGITFIESIQLGLNNPQDYSQLLESAMPMINGFGGGFLLLVALSFFVDSKKTIYWLNLPEKVLHMLGKWRYFVPVLLFLSVFATGLVAKDSSYLPVVMSIVCGVAVFAALRLVEWVFGKKFSKANKHVKTGVSALAAFIYLEVLDASFSFDSVVGAFAITQNIILIVAGLGIGAFWVRSMTIHMLESKVLQAFRFLEHGAHWAILSLGIVMLVKIGYHDVPEWVIGGLSVLFIVWSLLTSWLANRRVEAKEKPASSGTPS